MSYSGLRRWLALCAAMLLVASHAAAQRRDADSVRVFESIPDTEKVLTLNARSWALRRSDPAAAIANGNRSLEIARRARFRRGLAQALNYTGVAYQWLGDNKRASRLFFEALGVADSAGIIIEKGYALNNIAALELLGGDGEQALVYANRAMEAQQLSGDRRGIAYAHIRLSEVDNFLKRYDDAIAHATAAHDIWTELHVTSTGLTALRSLALAYEGKAQYDQALAQLLAIVNSDSVPAAIRLHDYDDLARVYLRLNQPDMTIATGLKKLAGGEADPEIMRYLAEAYAAKRDWVNAYKYSQREAVLQDSVARGDQFRQLKNLQFSYETSQKESENQLLRDQLRLSRYLEGSSAVALLLATYAGFSLFGRRRREHEVNRLLAGQLEIIKESERALAENSRRQRTILDNVPDAMWVKDASGRYTAVNESFCRFVGRPMSEIEGKTVADFFSVEDASEATDHEAAAFAAREPVSTERTATVRGSVRAMETTVSPLFDAAGALIGTTGVARDITERKRDEAQKRRAQHLESLGVLAGGIAHDFNNLLLGILGNAALARNASPPDSAVLSAVGEIEQAALRAADLSRKMLAYTGTTQLGARTLDLSAIVGEHAANLRGIVPAGVTLRVELAAGLPPMRGDEPQLVQLVMSLVTNAAESFESDAGTVSLRTADARISADRRSALEAPLELPEGDYVLLEVSDTGRGMASDVLSKIFEPFFSTKFVGRGLGLAAVMGIVRGHQGTIDVQSQPGRGSRFRVYFPAVVEPSRADQPPLAPPSTPAGLDSGGSELILVVDDEPAVRRLVQRVLEMAGFRVIVASDGVEGVEMVRKYHSSIALVVLDLLMPRLGGEGALEQMRQMSPQLPVILSSGFSGEVAADRLRGRGSVEFIAKPYRNEALIALIRSMLGRVVA